MPGKTVEAIWTKLTEYNPCCSCCSGDDEYITLVNEIGAMIDGRKWVRKRVPMGPPSLSGFQTVYETIPARPERTEDV